MNREMVMNASERPGELLGRRVLGYVLDEVIGAGGMGAIYGATSRFVKKRAAVKVMLQEVTENAEAVGWFLQEAFVASSIDHPNIVEIWGADRFAEDGRLYILMPLIEGKSLDAVCKSARLSLEHAGSIAIQTAGGLAAAHAMGIVHRDFKEENVLLTTRNNITPFAKIVDFGVARLLGPQSASAPRRTRTGLVVGTPRTMAPEQAGASRGVDARADIYSWGSVLYSMLTGRAPYVGDSMWELYESALTGAAFPRPRSLRPEIPRVWEDVILACLEFHPNNRPSSMEAAVRRMVEPLRGTDLLLALLAPNLARSTQIGADGKTFTGELDARWFDVRAVRPRSRDRALAWRAGAALAVGAAAAAVTMGVARDESEDAAEAAEMAEAPKTAEIVAPVVAVSHDAAIVAPIAPDARELAQAPALAPQPPPPAPTPPPAPSARRAVAPPVRAAQHGTLAVYVKPWGEVWIDGQHYGQAPVRKELKAGRHVVKLKGPDDKTEEKDVHVRVGKFEELSWDWGTP